MASSKSQCSDSAALPEELSEVQVLDSNEPLVTASSSVPPSAQVIDSSEPLVATSSVPRSVQVIDSSERLVPTSTRVQVLDSNEPLVLLSSVLEDPVAGPSNLAGPSRLPYSAASRMANAIMPDLPIISEDELEAPSVTGSSGRRVHHNVEDIRSMWNWKKFFSKLGTNEQCVQFAEARGMVPTTKSCTKHHRPMSLTMDSGLFGRFRCRKGNCRTRVYSRATGTWFENARLGLPAIFQLMYAFAESLSYEDAQKQVSDEEQPILSYKTIADWYSYCRETICVYVIEHNSPTSKIGGPNKIVQIDESRFGRRKYNRGRHIEGHWVIGMIEDGSEDLRLEVCPDNERSAEVLVPLIKKHVQEGSIIHTDMWRAYQCLPEHGYVHKTVNHSDPVNKFVAPDGTHTQRIESQWRGLKKVFRQQHNKSDFTDWLIEYTWRRNIKINHLDPYEELLKAIIYVYNNVDE